MDCASFRGAAGLLRHTTGADLVTNGEMEGTYSGGVASGWTEYDPSGIGTPSYGGRFTMGTAQACARTFAASGTQPGVTQTISTVAGTWYRLGFWVSTESFEAATRISIGGMLWDVTAPDSGTWTYGEIEFQAAGSTTEIRLLAQSAVSFGDAIYWDDVTCRAVTDWCWDFVQEDEQNSRDWLNEALGDAMMRSVEDSIGRTCARVWWPGRPAIATFGSGAIVEATRRSEDQDWRHRPEVKISRTAVEDEYTGVVVRYGWDARLRKYRGSTWVSCEQESTGQAVVSASGLTVTLASTATVYPSGRWTSRKGVHIAIAGRSVTITDDGYGVPDFVADGVEAGDWFWGCGIQGPVGYPRLSRIASVDGPTTLTLEDSPGDLSRSGQISCFPWLFRVGGAITLPVVEDGPGTEDAEDVEFADVDPELLGVQTVVRSYDRPAIGDVVWRLISDSSDGLGVRDQTRMRGPSRERQSMVRLATRGQVATKIVESKRIQDRETAVALRDALFDYYRRRYVAGLDGDLSELGIEPGDVVDVESADVPGGVMRGEIVGETIRIEECTLGVSVREV